jgi:hypothetical protein
MWVTTRRRRATETAARARSRAMASEPAVLVAADLAKRLHEHPVEA